MPARIGRSSGRVALYFREDAPLLGPPSTTGRGEPPAEREHELLRERLAASPCFFSDLLADVDLPPQVVQEALWDLVWAGEVTNDAWAPLRAPRLTLARAAPARERRRGASRRFGARRPGAQAQVQGRWSLTGALFAPGGVEPAGPERRRSLAELLLERHGVLTREAVLAEGVAGGFAALYDSLARLETLGIARRGYFVEGLGGAQFALPGAVERLRAQREAPAGAVVLAATDPAQPYGAALPWPRRDGQEKRRPARTRGAYVVLSGAEPIVYVEGSGRGLLTLVDLADERILPALEALAEFVRAGRIKRLGVEHVNGEPIFGSPLEPMLIELGFRQGPRRLTLSA